jgi:NADH dehydrogenase FAD-containing subunit
VRKQIILVGAGHAHLLAISKIPEFAEQGHTVTVVSPEPYHYYSGMGPGMLSGIYRPQQARFDVAQLTENSGGSFIRDSVVSFDPKQKILNLKNQGELDYDLVSFNTGSRVPREKLIPGLSPAITAKPVQNLFSARETILKAAVREPVRVMVVGGGAAGIEIAANASMLHKSANRDVNVCLVARGQILNSFRPKVRRLALKKLHALGITVFEKCEATRVKDDRLELTDGRCLFFDFIFLALGTRPHEIFRKSGVPIGPDGGLLVNEYLQSTEHPEVYGAGDCIYFQPRPLPKVGVYALRQAPIIYHNLLAAASNKRFRPFIPQRKYLLILNMGDRTGIFQKSRLVFSGGLAFKLKDYIDRQFMGEFQLSGELSEDS